MSDGLSSFPAVAQRVPHAWYITIEEEVLESDLLGAELHHQRSPAWSDQHGGEGSSCSETVYVGMWIFLSSPDAERPVHFVSASCRLLRLSVDMTAWSAFGRAALFASVLLSCPSLQSVASFAATSGGFVPIDAFMCWNPSDCDGMTLVAKRICMPGDLFQDRCSGSSLGTDERSDRCLVVGPDGYIPWVRGCLPQGLLGAFQCEVDALQPCCIYGRDCVRSHVCCLCLIRRGADGRRSYLTVNAAAIGAYADIPCLLALGIVSAACFFGIVDINGGTFPPRRCDELGYKISWHSR